jgi:hypothetical protein
MTKYAAFALALVLAAPALADESTSVKPYSNATWGFSAIFPYAIKEQPGENGGITISSANAEDTIAYMLSVFPIADEVLKVKAKDKILEDAVKGAVDNVKGTLLLKTNIQISGFPGKQFDIKSDQFVAKCRIYLVGNRMYLPMVIAAPSLNLPITAEAFHAAFKLTKK